MGLKLNGFFYIFFNQPTMGNVAWEVITVTESWRLWALASYCTSSWMIHGTVSGVAQDLVCCCWLCPWLTPLQQHTPCGRGRGHTFMNTRKCKHSHNMGRSFIFTLVFFRRHRVLRHMETELGDYCLSRLVTNISISGLFFFYVAPSNSFCSVLSHWSQSRVVFSWLWQYVYSTTSQNGSKIPPEKNTSL